MRSVELPPFGRLAEATVILKQLEANGSYGCRTTTHTVAMATAPELLASGEGPGHLPRRPLLSMSLAAVRISNGKTVPPATVTAARIPLSHTDAHCGLPHVLPSRRFTETLGRTFFADFPNISRLSLKQSAYLQKPNHIT